MIEVRTEKVRIAVYTLKALASKEKVSYGHLRRLVAAMDDAVPKEWRQYRLIRVGEVKTWLAVPKDAPVDFITE